MQTCSFRPSTEALRTAFWMLQLGQFIASSPTLFPKEYVTEFQKCLDQTGEFVSKTFDSALPQAFSWKCSPGKPLSPWVSAADPIPWATIRKTIQTELGQPLEDIFLRVDPTPLACASVAQARLLCMIWLFVPE